MTCFIPILSSKPKYVFCSGCRKIGVKGAYFLVLTPDTMRDLLINGFSLQKLPCLSSGENRRSGFVFLPI